MNINQDTIREADTVEGTTQGSKVLQAHQVLMPDALSVTLQSIATARISKPMIHAVAVMVVSIYLS